MPKGKTKDDSRSRHRCILHYINGNDGASSGFLTLARLIVSGVTPWLLRATECIFLKMTTDDDMPKLC